VAQAVMIGDNRHFCTALITLDVGYLLKEKMGVDISNIKPTELLSTLESKGKTVAEFAADPDILSEIQEGVDKVNTMYAQVENIRKFAVLPRDFTMVDDEVTPTFKIKRAKIYTKWSDTIDSLYAE